MTSSSSVNAHSTVRVARELEPRASTPWSLDELAMESVDPLADRTNVEQMMVLAVAQREQFLDEGYSRGLADGLARATAAGEKRVNEVTAILSEAVRQLEEAGGLAPGILEENIAALAVIVARQIVAREVTTDPQIIADLVRRALTEFPVDQSLRIRVNPLDLSLLSGPSGNGAAGPITGARDASWLADGRVSRGGCLIEGRDRVVDGRVDTALERAYRRMAAIDAT